MSDYKVIPDYMIGPDTSLLMVSKRFKELVETWDPVKHVFVPLEVEKLDGTILKDQHFLFYTQGDIEGAIDVGPSDVEEKWLNGKITRYANRLEPPLLYWRRSKINGRHIWSDPMFKEAIVVSDEFYTWHKRNNISGYQAQQNLITEDEA